jgi:hypothetical protein
MDKCIEASGESQVISWHSAGHFICRKNIETSLRAMTHACSLEVSNNPAALPGIMTSPDEDQRGKRAGAPGRILSKRGVIFSKILIFNAFD